MTHVDLYENNGGGLTAAKDDGQPWHLGFNGLEAQFRGKFKEDAAAWAAGEWEPNENDGQQRADADWREFCEHVAVWRDGVIWFAVRWPRGEWSAGLRGIRERDPLAGFSAQGYLGILDEDGPP
jgi:hypothetical protein